MAVDPEISLGLKPLASPFSSNPLETLGSIQGLQAQQNQLKMFGQTFAARQKAGQIIASAPTLAAGLDAASKDPDVMGFAGDVYNVAREAQLAQTRVAGETQEQGLKGYGVFTKALPSTLTNPDSFGPNASTALSLTSPAARGSVDAAIRNVHDALTTGLPDDPTARAAELSKRIVATSVGAGGIPADQLHAIIGTNTTQDLGDVKTSGVQAPPQGAPAMLGGAAAGSYTPTSQLSLGLPPTLASTTDKSGVVTPNIVSGGRGGPLPNPLTGGATEVAPGPLDTADGPQISLPTGGRNPLAPQLPPVPKVLLDQLQTPQGGKAPTPTPAPAGTSIVPLTTGGPSLAQQNYTTNRIKDLTDQQNDLDHAVTTGNTLVQNLGEARDALKDFKPGGGADTYAKLASVLQGVGFPQSVVDKVGNGNVGSSQEFQKLMVNTTNAQIKQQVGGSIRGQQEFDTFQKNNPNIQTDPRAIDKIFNFWTKVYQRNAAEQTQQNQFLKSGGDITDWPSEWQKRSKALGFIDPTKTDSSQGTSAKPALADIFK